MSDCICPECGKEVLPDQQYMIGHVMSLNGIVAHTVTHFDCLITPTQGSGKKTSSEVAASTSRSKEA